MDKTNILDGWKKLLVAGGGLTGLSLEAVPENLVWPYSVIVAAALIAFAIQDYAKARGKVK